MLYTGLGTGSSWPRFDNIIVENCSFTHNRRHGGSGESMRNARFINCTMNSNGLDLNNTSPLNDGNRGARESLGNLYGNGFDMEGYGPGYYWQDIVFSCCEALGNATDGIKFYNISSRTDPGELPSTKMNVDKCWLDKGTIGSDTAIVFTSTIPNKANGALFEQITLTDCLIDGRVIFRACDSATINGGDIFGSGGQAGVCDNATKVIIGCVELNGSVFFSDASTFQYVTPVQTTLASGATLDLGLPRTLTQALLTVYSSQNSFPVGGTFAATAFLDAGGGVYINDIRGNGAVSTGATTMQIVASGTNWALKNNSAAAIKFTYALQL